MHKKTDIIERFSALPLSLSLSHTHTHTHTHMHDQRREGKHPVEGIRPGFIKQVHTQTYIHTPSSTTEKYIGLKLTDMGSNARLFPWIIHV